MISSCQRRDRGASRTTEIVWYVVKWVVFLTAFRWPSAMKVRILRVFGAEIGTGVVVAPRVNIHMPWKLAIGDFSWIGEEVLLLNLEPITIGSGVVISQRAFLCTGNHDYGDPTFRYFGAPIRVGDGVWVAAQSFVGPGVDIGTDTVVTAGSVVLRSLPDAQVCSGNPCRPVKRRVIRPR